MRNPNFGGDWTKKKLSVLEEYLNAYTTALKDKPYEKRPFKLIYIDAFAGSGRVETSRSDVDPSSEVTSFLEGSVARAIRVTDKPFDELIFVEQDRQHYYELKQRLEANHPHRDIILYNEDANKVLLQLERDWRSCRGVLFLDPFGTQVEFRTIEKVASFNALDTWILVPVSTISRLLPKNRDPSDISQKWKSRLNRIYGDDSWQDLYQFSSQGELFDLRHRVRNPGIKGLVEIYKQKLEKVFGNRFLGESLALKNSKNSVMYELMFCCGNPSSKAINLSKRIAKYLIKIQDDG